MNGKDILRILLISYGFCRKIDIKTYAAGRCIGYEVSASNDDGIRYHNEGFEGLLFHIFEIQDFMRDRNIPPRIMRGRFSNKYLLSDEHLNNILSMPENKGYCKTDPYKNI